MLVIFKIFVNRCNTEMIQKHPYNSPLTDKINSGALFHFLRHQKRCLRRIHLLPNFLISRGQLSYFFSDETSSLLVYSFINFPIYPVQASQGESLHLLQSLQESPAVDYPKNSHHSARLASFQLP